MVLQLQHLAQKSDSNLEELLRRAKLVAVKLNLKDFENWCNFELMGYEAGKEIPDYRMTFGRLYVKNPYNGLVPLHFESDEVYKDITTVYLFEPVGQYINLINKAQGSLSVQLSKEALDFLYKAQSLNYSFILEPHLQIEVSQIMNVLTYVRNLIFDWSVNLEKIDILGEGMQFTVEEKAKAMTNTTYHIGNMQGIVGHVQDSQITQNNQMIVNQMDLSILLTTLRSVGINEDDLKELQSALEEDIRPSLKNNYGEKVSTWYGKMISKAADGSWEIAIGTAANLLTQALNSFYGLA